MKVSSLNEGSLIPDELVRKTPEARLCHLPSWSRMVERTFKHEAFYLIAHEDTVILGVLPLTLVRSRLFGTRMVSQAFSNYGGPLAQTRAALDALYQHAVELATRHGCDLLELRNSVPISYEGWAEDSEKLTMYLPLTADPEELWKSFKPKVRNQVRKAEKSGITALEGGPELLDDFYRVWTVRMRQLGTPCYARRLFSAIMETFPENCRVFLVRLNRLTVGGAFVYCFQGLVQIRWAATLPEYNTLCPNNLLYWAVMKAYCLADGTCFDFGRTTVGSGPHRFKKQWGAEAAPLHYQYWTRPGHDLSLLRPDNPRYKRKVEMWKRIPLWMTRLIGPYVSRDLV